MKCFVISDLHIDHYLGSNPSIESIKQLLKPHLLPADVLIVAGDISNYSKCIIKTITALSELYEHVVWTIGNHDMAGHNGESSYAKIAKITNTIKLPNVFYMDGIPADINGITFGGSMGYCDFTYAETHFGQSKEQMSERWKSWYDGKYWNIQGTSPVDFFNNEYTKLLACIQANANVMVSHFGPFAHNIRSEFHNLYTGFFYFDGTKLLEKMPENSIWCFGHTHDYIKTTVGNVTLLCNPFGYPDESRNQKIPKEEFLFDV